MQENYAQLSTDFCKSKTDVNEFIPDNSVLTYFQNLCHRLF